MKIKARIRRARGQSIIQIAKELGVSKASVSYWVRDIPQPEKFTAAYRASQRAARLALIRFDKERRRKERVDRRLLNEQGYVLMLPPEGYAPTGRVWHMYIYEHRYVMEQHLGRYLLPGEIIHHINGVRNDNRVDNLSVTTQREHTIHHKSTGVTYIRYTCEHCGQEFSKPKRGKTYRYCSRSCASSK